MALGEGNGAGRPSALDNPETLRKIKNLVLKNHTWEEIAVLCVIPIDTIQDWIQSNFRGFADDALAWKHERMLRKAERNIESDAELETLVPALGAFGIIKDADGKTVIRENPALRKLKQDASLFIAETLGKQHYSKRKEVTGAGGAKLISREEVEATIKGLDKNIKTDDKKSDLETACEDDAGQSEVGRAA